MSKKMWVSKEQANVFDKCFYDTKTTEQKFYKHYS